MVTDLGPFSETVLFEELRKLGAEITLCGSQFTCNPAPGGSSDWDYLIEVPDVHSKISKLDVLMNDGNFSVDDGEHYQSQIASAFCSYKNADKSINLLVTSNRDFAKRHHLATAVCKRLNLMEKKQRILLFQVILYNNLWEKYDVEGN